MSTVAVAALVVTELLADARADVPRPEEQLADWLTYPLPRRRQRVWVAVGKIMKVTGMTAEDALAVLRSRAFTLNHTVDDLSMRL